MDRQSTNLPRAPSGHPSDLQDVSLAPSSSQYNTNGATASFEVESGSMHDDKRGLFAGNERSYSYPTSTSTACDTAAPPEVPLNPHDVEPVAKWYHSTFHTVTAVVGAGVLGLP